MKTEITLNFISAKKAYGMDRQEAQKCKKPLFGLERLLHVQFTPVCKATKKMMLKVPAG